MNNEIGQVLSGTVIAALITGLTAVYMSWRKNREEERSRIRNVLAEAFTAYASYKEFPYVIARRDASDACSERRRISTEIRAVQEKLSYYEAWTAAEAPAVGEAYSALIGQMRAIAGSAMRAAWTQPAVSGDGGMNNPVPGYQPAKLVPFEKAYVMATAEHLARFSGFCGWARILAMRLRQWWISASLQSQAAADTETTDKIIADASKTPFPNLLQGSEIGR